MKRILVTGAGGSASYNYIESLRHNPEGEQFYIVGTDSSRYHIELANVDKRYILPRIDDPTYLDKLNWVIEKEKIDFLHAQPDGEVNYISKNRDKINTTTFLPPHEVVEICQNKMEFAKVLQQQGLAAPEAYYIDSEKSLEEAMEKLLSRHEKVWLRAIRGAGAKGALPVKNVEHAKFWIDYWRVMKGLGYGDFMVSEFLPGSEYAFQSLWKDGELLMSQARERDEYIFGNLTPSGQSSSPSVAHTVQIPELNEIVTKAIKGVDPKPHGIYCADLKSNADGKIFLLEVNIGRFFTTSFFFSEAGLNMPYYYTKLGLGEEISHHLKPYDNIPANWYWVRMIDMGYKLIKENEWTSQQVQ